MIPLAKWKIFTPLQKLHKKCGRFLQNNCCHRLWKVAQSAINCPIWSHWSVLTTVGSTVDIRKVFNINILSVWPNCAILKGLCDTFPYKSSPDIKQIFGLFGTSYFLVKTAVATFWASNANNWANFYSSIWSHCFLELIGQGQTNSSLPHSASMPSTWTMACPSHIRLSCLDLLLP